MRLRAHRRELVVWRRSAGPARGYGVLRLTRPAGTRRIRRFARMGALLTAIGLIHLARAAWLRRQPLLAGGALTAVGIVLRDGLWSVVSVPGLWLLAYALLIPASLQAGRKRRSQLARELAVYSTPSQRSDLEATLDRYPDSVTRELRDALTSQALTARSSRIPGAGR
jgi:hypothetical protein